MVLDECSRLVADSQEKSNTKVEELNSEIRKLKAMIGKFFFNIDHKILMKWSISSETWNPNPNTWDKKQRTGEDVDKQWNYAQQQRPQWLRSWWSLMSSNIEIFSY